MREAVGSTWIYGLVLTFTLIFAGFLVIALSYSKTYKLKNEMTSMIEKYEGFTIMDAHSTGGSVKIINQYLKNAGYSNRGNCGAGEYGTTDLTSEILEETNENETYYYCISYSTNANCRTIFKVTLFYNFNLPFLGQLRKYKVTGETNEIYEAYFNGEKIAC